MNCGRNSKRSCFRWKDVRKKMMFGSPSYVTGGISFAMLVDGGIILTHLNDDQKSALITEKKAGYFIGHGRAIKKRILIPIRDPAEIDNFLPFITASYASAAQANEPGAE
jgi:hypothetical protein